MTKTFCSQEKRRSYTRKAPGDFARNYTISFSERKIQKQREKLTILYPGADADTDHKLVMMMSVLSLKNMKRKGMAKR